MHIKISEVEFYIDLGAGRILAAQKGSQKIAVEVKSFLGASSIHEFHAALGQLLNYRLALRKKEPERVLYMAISRDTYQELFTGDFVQESVAEYRIKLLLVNVVKEEIFLWKE